MQLRYAARRRSRRLQAVSFVILASAGLTACTDGLVQPDPSGSGTGPQLVASVDLGNGENQIQIDLEDAQAIRWFDGVNTLDPNSYAQYGVRIDSAALGASTAQWGGSNYARSGSTWFEPVWLQRMSGYFAPAKIALSFSPAAIGGRVRSVRIHVGRYGYMDINESFGGGIVYNTARLTCYSGSRVVGTQSVMPPQAPYGLLTPPPYFPLVVTGDSISRCALESGVQFVWDDLAITIAKTAAKLELRCTGDVGVGRVTRGSTLGCQALANPAGATLSNVQWVFVDTMGNSVPGPAASPSWGGTMVVGGRMRVTAMLNGAAASADSAIAVRPRRWSRLGLKISEQNPNHLPSPNAVVTSADLGDVHVDTLSAGYPGSRVDVGPNAGWWYLERELDDIPVAVHINYPAFQAGSAWYNLQSPGTWIDPSGTPQPYCAKSDVSTLRTLTRRHEGSISASPGETSHTDAMRRYLATSAPQDQFESLLAHDTEVQTFTFAETVRSYYRTWIQGNVIGASRHQPAGSTSIPAFPCKMRF